MTSPALGGGAGATRPGPAVGRFGAYLAWRPDPLAVIGILGLIALWYLGHLLIGKFMPPPHTVITAAFVNFYQSDYFVGLGLPSGGYLPHLISTTITVLTGVIIGGLIGTITGLLSARSWSPSRSLIR